MIYQVFRKIIHFVKTQINNTHEKICFSFFMANTSFFKWALQKSRMKGRFRLFSTGEPCAFLGRPNINSFLIPVMIKFFYVRIMAIKRSLTWTIKNLIFIFVQIFEASKQSEKMMIQFIFKMHDLFWCFNLFIKQN